MTKTVTILVIATNAYLPLAVRLVKRFNHYYIGDNPVRFRIITDQPLDPYLPPGNWSVEYRQHKNWVDGTSSKFVEMVAAATDCSDDYLFVLDADTNFDKKFTLDWLLHDLVACEHFGNRTWMAEVKNFDRNPKSRAYVPKDTPLPQTYVMGMLYGGKTFAALQASEMLLAWQGEDERTGNQASVQDESYINKFVHVTPSVHIVPITEFPWVISDKGGIGETRNVRLDIRQLLVDLAARKDSALLNISHGAVG